jgi:hypothetical protein
MLYLPRFLVERSTFEAQPGLNLISMNVLKLTMKYSNKLQFVEASPRETTRYRYHRIKVHWKTYYWLSFAKILVIQPQLNLNCSLFLWLSLSSHSPHLTTCVTRTEYGWVADDPRLRILSFNLLKMLTRAELARSIRAQAMRPSCKALFFPVSTHPIMRSCRKGSGSTLFWRTLTDSEFNWSSTPGESSFRSRGKSRLYESER